jgi:hypothetical protein
VIVQSSFEMCDTLFLFFSDLRPYVPFLLSVLWCSAFHSYVHTCGLAPLVTSIYPPNPSLLDSTTFSAHTTRIT